jgi:hypothetical protein
MVPQFLDPRRRAALLQTKLRALVAERWGHELASPAVAGSHPGGATLRSVDGSLGWVLAEDRPARSLGAALAWAEQAGVAELHLLVEGDPTVPARRAAYFSPSPAVWIVDGRSLAPATPGRPAAPAPLPTGAATLAPVIRQAGADAVVEHGALRAEVLGLEVGRVAVDGSHLEVGVGRHDREAHRMLAGEEEEGGALARAVAEVRRHRRAGAPAHPANQLAKERWLRAVLLRRPELAAARTLVPVDPPDPVVELAARSVAPALGEDGDGAAVLVVASTGVDPELVPAAADAREAQEGLGMGPLRLVLAVPEGDDHPMTRALAARLSRPAEVRRVTRDWQRA